VATTALPLRAATYYFYPTPTPHMGSDRGADNQAHAHVRRNTAKPWHAAVYSIRHDGLDHPCQSVTKRKEALIASVRARPDGCCATELSKNYIISVSASTSLCLNIPHLSHAMGGLDSQLGYVVTYTWVLRTLTPPQAASRSLMVGFYAVHARDMSSQ
jgi:hypothetical protein